MSQEPSHLEFTPPDESGGGGSLLLALFVHALLLMALTWGIQWRTDPQDEALDAELWSNIPEPIALKSDPPAPPKTEPDPRVKSPPLKKEAPPAAKVIDQPNQISQAALKKAADAEIAIEKRRKKEVA